MPCDSCDKKPKNNESCAFTKATVEINNPKQLSMFRKVVVPASMGDDVENPPKVGKYCNVILYYEANDQVYLYSSDGIPTRITVDIDELKAQIAAVRKDLTTETTERKDADQEIWTEIETIEASSDVVDVVGTYAELQQYDTSKLHDNDLIKVLQDETHDDAITYYRWNGSAFTYVGAEGPYYTASETDALLADKQDKLTAGANIQIASDGTISATDTTYTHFTGATSSTDGVQGLVPGPLAGDQNKYLKGDGTWGTVSGANYSAGTGIDITNDIISIDNTVVQEKLTAGTNIQINGTTISATDTTYADFVGTDGQTAGTRGLVPAPSTADAGEFLKADGTWATPPGTIYAAGTGIDITNSTIAVDTTVIQEKLTAGSNITINNGTISATDTTYSSFGGATSSVAGSAGLVPAPTTSDPDKYLKGDGTWSDIPSANNINTTDWNALWQ